MHRETGRCSGLAPALPNLFSLPFSPSPCSSQKAKCWLQLGLLLAACGSTAAPAVEPAIDGFELIYAVAGPDGPRVGGLDDSVPPSTRVTVSDASGVAIGEAVADADGRFDIALISGSAATTVVVTVDGVGVPFRLRDPEVARGEAVRPSIDGAGSSPNDLVIAGAVDGPHAVVVRSGDNALSTFDLQSGLQDGVRMPGSDPWFAAPLNDAGTRFAVTGIKDHSVHIVDVSTQRLERTLVASAAAVLAAPFTLASPVDVDGNGIDDTVIDRLVPRSPQAVAVAGGKLVVAYSGFVGPGVFVPGVVAMWTLDDLDAAPTYVVLDRLNPQELRMSALGLLVVCSGALDFSTGTWRQLSPSAVHVLDTATSSVTRTFELDDFVAGTALVAAGGLWAGSIVSGTLRRVDLVSNEVTSVTLNDEVVDSVFRMLPLPGGLIAVPSYNTDRLHILDPRTATLAPPPYYGPLVVGPGRPVFDGLQICARRPGRAGVDFVGPDIYCLAAASRVTPIETRKLLGP